MKTKTHCDILVYENSGIQYICWEDIPEVYIEEFQKWFYGQTGMITDNCKKGFAVYAHDFNRRFDMKFNYELTHFE